MCAEPQREPGPSGGSLRLLAGRVADGDDAAFEEIHRRLRAGIQRFFLKRTNGRLELAEELCQRTWVETWRVLRARRYDPQRAAVSTYVYAIACKLWLREQRAAGRAASSADYSETCREALVRESPDGSEVLHAAELIDAVQDCLRAAEGALALTSAERLIIEHLSRGESERHLAGRLGLAASTVNARKRSACEKIRKALAERGFLPD